MDSTRYSKSWRDEEVSSAGAAGIFPCTAKMLKHKGSRGIPDSQKNPRGLRKTSSKLSSGWKAPTNAEKCGLGELVHELIGAHDVQGDIPATTSVHNVRLHDEFAMPALMLGRSLRPCEETPQSQGQG